LNLSEISLLTDDYSEIDMKLIAFME
jgi:hypothetical protein